MQGEVKMVCLTQIRAGPHLLAVRKQLLAVSSSVASLEDSLQKKLYLGQGQGAAWGAFFKKIQTLSFAWLVAFFVMLEV